MDGPRRERGNTAIPLRHTLPPELIDRIIDFLWDDARALCNCALTCRDWFPRSHYQLYSILYIRRRSTFDSLVRLTLRTPHTRQYLSFVRELSIEDDHKHPFAHVVPHMVGRYMSGVTTLRFLNPSAGVQMPLGAHPSFFLLVSQFSSVTKLEVANYYFSSFGDIRRFVCAFPQLADLYLGSVWLPGSATLTLPSLVRPRNEDRPRLRSLRLGYGTSELMAQIVDWLLSTPSKHTIQGLHIYSDDVDWLSLQLPVSRLVQSLGVLLEHLTLPRMVEDYVAMALVTLKIREAIYEHSWDATWTKLSSILAHITSSRITSLDFSLDLTPILEALSFDVPALVNEMDLYASQLRPIAAAIAHAHFARLQRVSLTVSCLFQRDTLPSDVERVFEQVEKQIRQLLLGWHVRGILKVSITSQKYPLYLPVVGNEDEGRVVQRADLDIL